MSYNTKVHKGNNGNSLVVESGGAIEMQPGSLIQWSNPTGAADYFVDLNNVLVTGDGSLASPFSTLAEAITASNTSIGLTANRWWARRNRIFVMGDGIAESLTVLPEKCDIIGMGSDLYPFPRITGVHTIAVAKVGCRFINMGFQASGTAHVFSIPAGCHGLEFIGCTFTASAAGNTLALTIADSAHVKIIGNKVLSSAGAVATSIFATCVNITGTASIHDLNICDNFLFGTAGVAIAAGALHGSFIARNIIRVLGGLAINDDSDDVVCVDNRFISSNGGLVEAQFCDWNSLLAVGNLASSNTAQSGNVPAVVVLTS